MATVRIATCGHKFTSDKLMLRLELAGQLHSSYFFHFQRPSRQTVVWLAQRKLVTQSLLIRVVTSCLWIQKHLKQIDAYRER